MQKNGWFLRFAYSLLKVEKINFIHKPLGIMFRTCHEIRDCTKCLNTEVLKPELHFEFLLKDLFGFAPHLQNASHGSEHHITMKRKN